MKMKMLVGLGAVAVACVLAPLQAGAETVATMKNAAGNNVVLTDVQGRCPAGIGHAYNERRVPTDPQLHGCWIVNGDKIQIEWSVFNRVFEYSMDRFEVSPAYRAANAGRQIGVIGAQALLARGRQPAPAATQHDDGDRVAFATNSAGGVVSLMSGRGECSDGLGVATGTAPSHGRTLRGCWRRVDDVVFVRWGGKSEDAKYPSGQFRTDPDYFAKSLGQ